MVGVQRRDHLDGRAGQDEVVRSSGGGDHGHVVVLGGDREGGCRGRPGQVDVVDEEHHRAGGGHHGDRRREARDRVRQRVPGPTDLLEQVGEHRDRCVGVGAA